MNFREKWRGVGVMLACMISAGAFFLFQQKELTLTVQATLYILLTLFDQNGERILDWSSRENGADLSEIPEPIYYVVYEMDESGRGTVVYLKRLIRDGHTWIIK